jgi:hypothetical protein
MKMHANNDNNPKVLNSGKVTLSAGGAGIHLMQPAQQAAC